MAQFAAQIYQEQGFGQLDMALSSTDPQQFADRIALVDTVMDVQSETMDRLATEQASLTALEDHLSALRADSAEKKKQAEAALARAQSARDAAAKAKAELDALAAEQATQAKSVAGKLATEKARLAVDAGRAGPAARRSSPSGPPRPSAARAAARRAAAKKHRPSGGTRRQQRRQRAPRGNGYLSRPVNAATSAPSTACASTRSTTTGACTPAATTPWPAARRCTPPRTAPSSAPAGAAATATGSSSTTGWSSGVGLATTYNHLSRIVKHGGRVKRGQLIGYSGTTGTSTGCHLHFETLENGNFVDPRKWL